MNDNDQEKKSQDNRDDALPRDEALRALYRQLPAEEPRAEIDAAILAAARRAVGAGPASAKASQPAWRSPRWQIPFAIAATMVLTLVIVREEPAQYAALQDVPVAAEAPAAEAARVDADTSAGGGVAATNESVADARAMTPQEEAAGPGSIREYSLTAERANSAVPPASPVVAVPAKAEAGFNAETGPAVTGAVREKAAAGALAAAPASAPPPAQALAVASPAASPVDETRLAKRSVALAADRAAPPQEADALPRDEHSAGMATRQRVNPWPFGLTPDLPVEAACAQLPATQVVSCVASAPAGVEHAVRELRITTHAPETFARELAVRLSALGWQAQPALPTLAGSARYTQTLEACRAVVSMATDARGVTILRVSCE